MAETPEDAPQSVNKGKATDGAHSEDTVDADTEEKQQIPAQMTESYSEISNSENQTVPIKPGPSRPSDIPKEANKRHSKLPLNIDGHTRTEGDMTHYVAHDLEFKIKLSSPVTKKSGQSLESSEGSLPNTPSHQEMDRNFLATLNNLEHESRCIAHTVDSLIENLSNVLHSNSTLTAENMDVYKNAVIKTCDAMDSNIKSMYTLLAKGEEISQAMISIQAQAARIAEIKRFVQLFESNF